MKTPENKILIILLFIQISLSCAVTDKTHREPFAGNLTGQYSVYIINNNLHTGIIIPLDNESSQMINALKYFKDYEYADFGWGEEDVYQNPVENYCLDIKAIMLVNSSVVRVEGYNGSIDSIVKWSDYAIKLTLSPGQFQKLCFYIDTSFKKDSDNGLFITSQKNLDRIIFFRSIYKYYLFNTCNTWIAKALKSSGLEVSDSVIITAAQLYKAIKDHGTVLKPMH